MNLKHHQHTVSVNDMIGQGRQILEGYHQKDAAIDARFLAMYLLNWDSNTLLLKSNSCVPDHVQQSYMFLIAKRAQGMPLQYITREQAFMGLDFYVDERVLIPRQDTELLIETLIHYSQHHPLQKAVEVGVGSGCISVALAHYIPNIQITAIDICQQALEVAKKNIINHDKTTQINLLQSDIFEKYDEQEAYLDLIVSNPPYITKEECHTLMPEVKHYEPSKALTDGGDGLGFYRRITKEGKKYLKIGGLLAYEIGYLQGEAVCAILKNEGFSEVRIIQDLTGKDRVVLGVKKA